MALREALAVLGGDPTGLSHIDDEVREQLRPVVSALLLEPESTQLMKAVMDLVLPSLPPHHKARAALKSTSAEPSLAPPEEVSVALLGHLRPPRPEGPSSNARSLLDDLVQEMELEVDREELSAPVTLNVEGELVSLSAYVGHAAATSVRAALGTELKLGAAAAKPLSPETLNPEQWRVIARGLVEASDPDLRLAVVGRGDYSPQQLIDEIDTGSDVGRRLVQAARNHSLLLTRAAKAGRIRSRREEPIELPAFDF